MVSPSAPPTPALAPLDAFLAAMPEAVRADFAAGAVGHGVFSAWCAARTPPERVHATADLVRAWVGREQALGLVSRGGSASIGWAIGIAMFDEARGPMRAFTDAQPNTHAIAAGTVAAFAAGIAAGLVASTQYWADLAGHVAERPYDAALAPAIGVGLRSDAAAVRRAAARLARMFVTHRPGESRDLIDDVYAAREGAGRGRVVWLADLATQLELVAHAEQQLSPLVDALGSDRDGELLGELLAEWRATGDAALEPLIAHLGAAIARARGPLSKQYVEIRDLAMRADPGDVDRLLEARWSDRRDAMARRITTLGYFEADPRIVATLRDRALEMDASHGLQLAIAMQLARAAAPSTLAAIDAIERRHPYSATYEDARAQVTAALARRARTAADAELVARALARTGAREDLAALWALHAEDPGDLGHRAVLGDALQRAHDPRGELIALQLALGTGRELPGGEARVQQLLAAYGRRWLPLPTGTDDVRFANGFVVALRANPGAERLAASFDDPEWITVEEVAFDPAIDVSPLYARMPLLRRLAVTDETELERLRDAPPRPPNLRAIACYAGWNLDAIDIPNIQVIGGRWVSASINAQSFRHIQHVAQVRGYAAIAHLQFGGHLLGTAVAIARESGPPDTRFCLGRYRGWRADGWCAAVARGSRAVLLHWTGGAASQFNLVMGYVAALVDIGSGPIRIATASRPLAQLHGLVRSLRARHPDADLEVIERAAPFDLGAPA